jgi:hypothetical protein
MSNWTAIPQPEITPQHCCVENMLYSSAAYEASAQFYGVVDQKAEDIGGLPRDESICATGDIAIKSHVRSGVTILGIQLRLQQDWGPVRMDLDFAVLGMSPEQALEVMSLPRKGRMWTAASQQALKVGDIVLAANLATLQFLASPHASVSDPVFELRTIGTDGEAFIIRVTILAERRVSGRAVQARRQDAPAVQMDPLAFGLISALTASLSTSAAAGVPTASIDAGSAGDRVDGQARADFAPKGDDPAQDPATDEPLVTGSVPKSDGQGARSPDARRRWVGSGTPPDSWHSGETAIEKSTAEHFDQLTAPSRPPAVGFDEQRLAVPAVGSFDLPPAGRASPQVVSGARATEPAAPTVATSSTARPVAGNDGGATATEPASPPVATPATARPFAGNDGGYLVLGGKRTIQATALLTNDRASPGSHLAVDAVFAAQQGTVTYDAVSQEITFVASAGYRGNASFSYTVKDDQGRSAPATVTLFVVPDERLFDSRAQPVMDPVNDPNAVELGVRFVSASDGVITGLRFYKGADNVGNHTASLWNSSGTLLATATFSGETGSGWQQVALSNPVAIRAGLTYVASYHTDGLYSADRGYFASPVTSGDLTAIGSVYAYGSSSVFPTNSYNSNNYWVDVVYSRPPAPPGPLDDVVGAIAAGHSTSIASSLLLANDRNPDGLPLSVTAAGSAVNGTAAYDPQTQAVIFTPASGYSGAAGFSYTVTNSLGVSATADVKLWVAGAQPATFFDAAAVPSVVTANDSNSVELGFKFYSTVDGDVVGLRFFKGADNTGAHVGNLWSTAGDLLATATFTHETAEGWQQVMFSTPVSLTAGVTYTASYHTDGNYSADPGFFANSHTNGMLIAPASASGNVNGLYAYGSASLFPTNSFNATGYGVDVLFKANLTG